MNRPYHTHQDLPPLAGLATFGQASQPGLAVEDCVRRFKRFHYSFWRLHQICLAHLPSEPLYELKMAFSLHAHLCAENDTNLRTRVGEMREPPLGLEKTPHPALGVFFDEILGTPSTEERVLGLYEKAFPALRDGLKQYIEETHPLADAPSIRLLRFALIDLEDICRWGANAVKCLVTDGQRKASAQWLALLDVCLTSAGGVDGSDPTFNDSGEIGRFYSGTPFQFDPVPRRDARFPDPYNMGVAAETFLYDETKPPEPKVLAMLYKRLREIDVPEVMASIITETRGKPWNYYRDVTRQLWDEARHAMMGETGFVAEGIDWPNLVMINFTWSLSLNTRFTPKERHAILYFVEQGLMPRTGKRHEWVVSKQAGNPLAITLQDFDWADEVLHARIGRDWYVSDMPSAKEAVEYGDQCWSKVVGGWKQWQQDGLTQHRNWWPDLYRAWCQNRGITPNPDVLAFDTTYETQRADLKQLAATE